MQHPAELDYLLCVLKKMHIPARVAPLEELPELPADFGLRQLLALPSDREGNFRRWLPQSRDNTIYKLSDEFQCQYIFLRLPRAPAVRGLLLGPYTLHSFSRDELMERAEHFRLPAGRLNQLETCFAHIPVLSDESPLLFMLSALGESLWGSSEAFEIQSIEPEPLPLTPPLDEEAAEREDILLKMRLMEERYASENELMDMVAQGRQHRAELMLKGFSTLSLERRSPDDLRNTKNYAIICNTLLRKAAERGGVHPIHLDSSSSHFARRIEGLLSAEKGQELMSEMLRSYCRLVRQHSGEQYSPPVQRVIAYIETNLAGSLSLRSLAEAQNLSAGYLSALFRRETGKTLTEYVSQRRMENGARLLRSTSLQVQTVAQHCGIPDVNYFSKLFKKHKGVTPKQYRQQQNNRHSRDSGG